MAAGDGAATRVINTEYIDVVGREADHEPPPPYSELEHEEQPHLPLETSLTSLTDQQTAANQIPPEELCDYAAGAVPAQDSGFGEPAAQVRVG